MSFLVGLNPFQQYLERKIRLIEVQERIDASTRAEKAEERAAFLAAITAMSQVAIETARATQAQSKVLGAYLNSFDVSSAPVTREWDPEANDRRYLEKHHPEVLEGLPKIEQFQLLLDKLNGDDK